MAIVKLWWSTSNFFPTDRFSGFTEEAGSGLTVVLRVAGRTDCRLTYGNVSLREAVWPGCAHSAEATSYEAQCSCLLGRSRVHLSPLEEAALSVEHSWFPVCSPVTTVADNFLPFLGAGAHLV